MAFTVKAGSADETYLIDEHHKRRVDCLIRQKGTHDEQIQLIVQLLEERTSKHQEQIALTDGRRQCSECGALFSTNRSDARYCSDRCRKRAQRHRDEIANVSRFSHS